MVEQGVRNPSKALSYLKWKTTPFLSGIEAAVSSRFPRGDNVLDEDWDLLIILDTCRLDALEEAKLIGNFQCLDSGSIESRYSVGGSTLEWTAQTFRESYRERANKVDYIAGNVLVEEVLDGRQTPENIDDAAWSPTKWETLPKSELNKFISAGRAREVKEPAKGHEDRPHPSARLVTDLAIKHGREHDSDQLIVHYVQPHYPYYGAIESDERDELADWEVFPFGQLRFGEVSRATVWNRYMAELRLGLDAIDILLRNYEAERVAITADHGEAFGERYLGVPGYKHRVGMLHPKVRQVPWAITSATDTGERIPDIDIETSDQSREEMLESLGYL
ncbi:LTA synthase family protein [Halococcus dombrowskii]|nr:LTA synthase family protein [Halococcus dombrowskii]UOO95164.1 LTA synthase family protein [Halococcus dombrowskii]